MGIQKYSVKRREEIARYFPNDFDFDEEIFLGAIDMDFQDVIEQNRKRPLIRRRNLLTVYLFMQGKTLDEVGELIERDHATVLHSLKEFQNACNGYDAEFWDLHMEILKRIPNVVPRYADININEAICLVNLDFLMRSKVA